MTNFEFKNTEDVRIGYRLRTRYSGTIKQVFLDLQFRQIEMDEIQLHVDYNRVIKDINGKDLLSVLDISTHTSSGEVSIPLSDNIKIDNIGSITIYVTGLNDTDPIDSESPNFVTFNLREENRVDSTQNHEIDRKTTSYCSVGDVGDWLRIDINKNTNPNTRMVEKIILRNEDEIDRRTGHTWRTVQYANEALDVNRIFDFGRGMAIYLKHRMVKPFNQSLGDKIEIWNGISYVPYAVPPASQISIEPTMGILYFRGFIFTLIRKHRFRITYRYGGDQEGTSPVPRDIEKACLLMTGIDILSTDFQFSQLAYGGEGNVNKSDVMRIWKDEIDRIIMNRSEIQTVW